MGTMDYTYYIKFLIGLIAITNPVGAIPIFLQLTEGCNDGDMKKLIRMIPLAFVVVLSTFLFFGELILAFFGISLNSFRISGGILIMLLSISMLNASTSSAKNT